MQSDKANTPEEVIDLVNEKDEIIGTVTKKTANSNPNIIHREIGVILFDKNNRILFQQRSKKKLIDPMVWTVSCEGHICARSYRGKTTPRSNIYDRIEKGVTSDL